MAQPEKSKTPSRLNVRLENELRGRIESAARLSLRSMNSEIIFRLKQSFERIEQATS